MIILAHQPPRQMLHKHHQYGKNRGSEGRTVVELYEELRHISCQTSRLSHTLSEVVAVEEEHLQLFLIGQRKGIADSPKKEHRQAEQDRQQPGNIFMR